MTLADITETIRQKMASAGDLKARVKFDFGADGMVLADTTGDVPVLSHEDGEADTTLSCSLETFAAILNGTQDPNIAFMMGKLKVAGSMGLAMKLNGVLES